LFSWINRKSLRFNVFTAKKSIPWWLSGISIYMLHLSVDQGQLVTGLVSRYGMKGMWILWASWLGVFVVPIVFAPLWKKLNFMTDNQFLLFRYQGRSGQFLHAFRAVYVGLFVVSLLMCFHLLGFTRVASVFFNLNESTSLVICGVVMCLFSLKNVFDLKVKTDGVHSILFFIAMLLSLYFAWQHSGGWSSVENYFALNPEKRHFFPQDGQYAEWFTFLVFFGIQWWSANLFDGGGPEMARFTAVKDGKRAIWAGLVPPLISLFISSLLLLQVLFIVSASDMQVNDQEKLYVTAIFTYTPDLFKGLIFLGFFGMFITTVEALMNWGASFLTVDIYQKYGNSHPSKFSLRVVSFGSMFLLSILSILFASQMDSLESLVKITFSISAGVAPVYLLRWFWYRINAWSQLSAMIASGAFTLLYPFIHQHLPFSQFALAESRMVFVTVMTTIVWLLVTLVTTDQSKQVSTVMENITGKTNILHIRRLLVAILIGALVLLMVFFFWWGLLY